MMRMEDKMQKAVIDADFFIKLTESASDKGELFCHIMRDLRVRPIIHRYVAEVELKRHKDLKKLVEQGKIDIKDYDEYIDRKDDKAYQEYFKWAYEKMNRLDFPQNEDIYTYHATDENLGEIRSIYLARKLNCMYFMSDDSGARSFAKNAFSSKKKLETMSIYEALKQCCLLKTDITLKKINPVLHAVFGERQQMLKELQKMYAVKN